MSAQPQHAPIVKEPRDTSIAKAPPPLKETVYRPSSSADIRLQDEGMVAAWRTLQGSDDASDDRGRLDTPSPPPPPVVKAPPAGAPQPPADALITPSFVGKGGGNGQGGMDNLEQAQLQAAVAASLLEAPPLDHEPATSEAGAATGASSAIAHPPGTATPIVPGPDTKGCKGDGKTGRVDDRITCPSCGGSGLVWPQYVNNTVESWTIHLSYFGVDRRGCLLWAALCNRGGMYREEAFRLAQNFLKREGDGEQRILNPGAFISRGVTECERNVMNWEAQEYLSNDDRWQGQSSSSTDHRPDHRQWWSDEEWAEWMGKGKGGGKGGGWWTADQWTQWKGKDAGGKGYGKGDGKGYGKGDDKGHGKGGGKGDGKGYGKGDDKGHGKGGGKGHGMGVGGGKW